MRLDFFEAVYATLFEQATTATAPIACALMRLPLRVLVPAAVALAPLRFLACIATSSTGASIPWYSGSPERRYPALRDAIAPVLLPLLLPLLRRHTNPSRVCDPYRI